MTNFGDDRLIYTRATRDGIRGDGTVSNGMVVQWISLINRWGVPSTPRPIPEGVQLIAYVESGLNEWGYRRLLTGFYDAELAALAATLPADAIVRWDHEMSSPPNEWRTWGQVDPDLYVKVWKYVAQRLAPIGQPERLMFWCPSGHKVDPDYFPGRSYVDLVGFTMYELGHRPARTGQRIPATTQWRKPLAAVRALAPGVPILIGETGSLDDDTGGRLRWIKSVKRVRGLFGVSYFDVDMTESEGRCWLLPGFLVKEWEA